MQRTIWAFFLGMLALDLPAEAESRHRSAVPATSIREDDYAEGGYANATSVVQGGEIELHIATRVSPFTARVIDLSDDRVVSTIENLAAIPRDCKNRWESGCGWPLTTTLRVPMSWPSGIYAVRFPVSGGERSIIFVVRSATPASTSPVIMISATNTYQAYNRYGGKSVYPSNSPHRAFRVSFDRPYLDNRGLGLFSTWEQQFVKWMRSENRAFEVATDSDMEDPTLLTRYRVVVYAGHAEYWTVNARRNLESFSAAGGHIAILGGNTMWWRARLEDNGRTFVTYKDTQRDPLRTTTNWYAPPNYEPENFITGASFRFGGFISDPAAYRVSDPSSWLFSGANVTTGQQFGSLPSGDEVDGALYNCDATGVPFAVDGSDGAPLNFHIAATVPASEGHATAGFYVNHAGGAVFNAGSRDWVNDLAHDPVVATMSRNVLTRFSTGERLPYDIVSTSVRMREQFNCPRDAGRPLPGWQGSFGGVTQTNRCAFEGPAGVELSGDSRIQIARGFSPRGVGLSSLEVRMRINMDAFTIAPEARYELLTLLNRGETVITRYARVAIVAKSLRVIRRGPAGDELSAPIDLGAGWHELRFAFSSPGTLVLQIDGNASVSLLNPDAGQRPTDVQLLWPAVSDLGRTGFVCVDDVNVSQ